MSWLPCKEWCLLTHNFIVFFVSRTDFAVKQCLLLAGVQDLWHWAMKRLLAVS